MWVVPKNFNIDKTRKATSEDMEESMLHRGKPATRKLWERRLKDKKSPWFKRLIKNCVVDIEQGDNKKRDEI